MRPDRLSNYPYVLVRVRCVLCDRAGQYRLARLAAKWGSELGLEELLDRLSSTCPYPRPTRLQKLRKYQPACGIYLADLIKDPPPRPDAPNYGQLVVIPGGRRGNE